MPRSHCSSQTARQQQVWNNWHNSWLHVQQHSCELLFVKLSSMDSLRVQNDQLRFPSAINVIPNVEDRSIIATLPRSDTCPHHQFVCNLFDEKTLSRSFTTDSVAVNILRRSCATIGAPNYGTMAVLLKLSRQLMAPGHKYSGLDRNPRYPRRIEEPGSRLISTYMVLLQIIARFC